MSALPLFYHNNQFKEGQSIDLTEETARHIVQVLRMQPGAQLQLTNGHGSAATVIIEKTGKKTCTVCIVSIAEQQPPNAGLHLAVAFTKNTSRNEWLLEKATELGVTRITPLLTARTQKEHNRFDRWNNILISAMLQSQQYRLPQLDEPTPFQQIVTRSEAGNKYIAHCMELPKTPLPQAIRPGESALLLIGPEGDFTEEELTLAIAHNTVAVSLGNTRLRTETAAIAACACFHLMNDLSL